VAEPNPEIVKSRPSIPEGDDNNKLFPLAHSMARNVGVSVPALPEADDVMHLGSLAKNAPVSSGDTDNFDINPAIQADRAPRDTYSSDGAANFPVPES
jgi:hypothetical protein